MEPSSMSLVRRLLDPDVLGVLIPIMLIVVFGGVSLAKKLIIHRERMAMIELGIHPDYPPDETPQSNIRNS